MPSALLQASRYVSDVRCGMVWRASSGSLSIALNNYLRLRLDNPSGSGKVAYVYTLGLATGLSALQAVTVRQGSSTAITANALTPRNVNQASALSPALTLAWDANASDAAGGVVARQPALIPGLLTEVDDLILNPGENLVVSLRATLAAAVVFNLHWMEESINA